VLVSKTGVLNPDLTKRLDIVRTVPGRFL
jgi:hypothetical protein